MILTLILIYKGKKLSQFLKNLYFNQKELAIILIKIMKRVINLMMMMMMINMIEVMEISKILFINQMNL